MSRNPNSYYIKPIVPIQDLIEPYNPRDILSDALMSKNCNVSLIYAITEELPLSTVEALIVKFNL